MSRAAMAGSVGVVVMKKKRMILIGSGALLVCISAALLIFGGYFKKPKTSGVLTDSETGKAMEYSLEILKPDEIDSSLVMEWLSGLKKTGGDEGYHTLYNNAVDVMDMYLYSPAANKTIGAISLSNVKAAESGTALIITIDTDRKAEADLLLHIYAVGAPQNASAKSELLIVDGTMYTGISSTFMALG